MRKLSVIIVSYDVKEYVVQCLLSLRRALVDIDAEIYVVDNCSGDGTAEYLRENFPEVSVIASNHNLGFARANNLAIKKTEGQYVLLLNPDTIVGEHTLHDCLTFMDGHEKAGGLGVRMLRSDGTDAKESRRGLPTPLVAFYKMSGLCNHFPESRRFGKYYMGYLSWDEPAQIEVISGAFCLLRRSALEKVGLLDEDFFMYGEDIDLSYRLLKGGFENWYFPAKILHYKGESTQKTSYRYIHVFYGAMLIFLRKHYSHIGILLSIPIKMAIFGKAFMELIKMQAEKARRSLGLDIRNRISQPLYVFIGNTENLQKCRTLAASKGLDAQFEEGTKEILPDGHLGMHLPEGRQILAVYDSESYSFETILSLFSRNPQPNVAMGTFLPAFDMMITTEEIMK